MTALITKDDNKQSAFKPFGELGFECLFGPEISHDGARRDGVGLGMFGAEV